MSEAYMMLAQIAQSGGLIYFALIFAAVLIYAMSPSRKKCFDEAARIPLQED